MPAAAIILAGGQGSRLGGVRKADLEVGGRRLLDRALEAVAMSRVRVVVGYEDLDVPPGVLITREDPPFSGPASAVAAGVAAIDAWAREAGVAVPEWVYVLATDMPGVGEAVDVLEPHTAEPPEVYGGHCLVADLPTGEQRMEWLAAVYATEALRREIARYAPVQNLSMRRLVSGMELHSVAVSGRATHDIDTWADHDEWVRADDAPAPEDL